MKENNLTTQSIAPFFKKNGLKIIYKKGHQFFRPEDTAQGIYYLESGQAMLYSIKKFGLEQIIAIGEKGTIFGKVGSVLSQPSICVSAQSVTECEVYRMNCSDFSHLIDHEILALKAYMSQVSRNNIYLLSQTLVLGEKDIYSRVINELLFLAEYHGDKEGERCVLRISLTQEELANMLCISREYLNKTIKKIKAKNLIQVQKQGRIIISNLNNLKKELGEI